MKTHINAAFSGRFTKQKTLTAQQIAALEAASGGCEISAVLHTEKRPANKGRSVPAGRQAFDGSPDAQREAWARLVAAAKPIRRVY